MKLNIYMKIRYEILDEHIGKTLLEYLESYNLGKTKIHLIFNENKIYVNGKNEKRNYILSPDDYVEIEYNEKRDFNPDNKKLDIIYEDDYLLIVNKPKNILVHPDDKNKNGTMCNIVSNYYQNKNIDLSIKYAHRLDLDTTGILIFAKDSLTLASIDKMISTHDLSRVYLCLTSGIFKEKIGTINAPIGEDRHHNQRKRISKTGKSAITHYEVLEEYGRYSLVKVKLETGRTHQIRVHLSYIGHPLIGDILYGGKNESRPMLHSYELDFIHPITKKEMYIKKDIPYDMKQLLDKWRKKR